MPSVKPGNIFSDLKNSSELEQTAIQELWRTTYSPILLIDQNCIVQYSSPSFAKVFSIYSDSLTGKSLMELIEGDQFPETLRGTLSVLGRGDVPFVELQGRIASIDRESGNSQVQLRISQTQDNSQLFLVTVNFSNEMSDAHVGCVPAHTYLEKIIENINAILWLKSINTNKVVYVSDNFEMFSGISKEEYLKNPTSFFDIIHAEDREKIIYADNTPEDLSNKTMSFRFQHRNGEWRHAAVFRFLINNQFGLPDTIAGLTIDDTDHYNAQLEIEKQRETLAQQNQELYVVNKNLEEFTYMAFHDLSMPLRVINTHIQILEDKYIKDRDSESMSLMHSVYISIYRMKSLIDSMVNLPNFMKDRSKQSRFICIRNLLTTKIKPLFINALNPNLQINQLRLTYLHVDEDHLITLFKNFIENGIKYNNRTEKLIQVHSRRFKTGAIVSISDNGMGISKNQQDDIFSFGKRGVDASAVAQGFGIGLAACKRIVELYKGKIWVRSKPGQGSTFYMYFPD